MHAGGMQKQTPMDRQAVLQVRCGPACAPLLLEHIAGVHARELRVLSRTYVRALHRLLPLLRHAALLELGLLLPARRIPFSDMRRMFV